MESCATPEGPAGDMGADVLRAYKDELCQCLCADVELLLASVADDISGSEYRRISQTASDGKVAAILDVMILKGDDKCREFLQTLMTIQGDNPTLRALLRDAQVTSGSCMKPPAPPSGVQHCALADEGSNVVAPVISMAAAVNIPVTIQRVTKWDATASQGTRCSGPPQMSQDAQQGSRFTVQAFRGSNAVAPMLTAVGGTIDMPIMIGDWPGPRPQVVSSEEGALDELEFLRLRLPQLAQRVKNVEAIIDELGAASFSSEAISDIRAQRTAENKVREMVRYANNCQAARDLYRALLSHESHLMAELA
ncbi:uncharacterized protein LOC114655227 [Erpetoichthys calabaricus]|uniref:uncharacterized protein LOC114655227 n=1 Tax=Erpetoichthys calabaricus TaxID=27687 RepID=UPI00109F14FE|nr:uncharacterized protein LOC114655227 [Erpetoichthys calabaricus]